MTRTDFWNVAVAFGATVLFLLLIGTELTSYVITASNLASEIADEQPCVDEARLRSQITTFLGRSRDARQLMFGLLMGGLAVIAWLNVVIEVRRRRDSTRPTDPEAPE